MSRVVCFSFFNLQSLKNCLKKFRNFSHFYRLSFLNYLTSIYVNLIQVGFRTHGMFHFLLVHTAHTDEPGRFIRDGSVIHEWGGGGGCGCREGLTPLKSYIAERKHLDHSVLVRHSQSKVIHKQLRTFHNVYSHSFTVCLLS